MPDAVQDRFRPIHRVETIALTVPIRPFQTTKQVRAGDAPIASLDFVFVKIYAGDLVGLGECVVMPVLFNQTVEGIRAVIDRQIGPRVLGLTPFDMERIGAIVDKTRPGGFIKASIDMALHDLVGKSLGVPVHMLIGGLVRERIPVCAEVSTSHPEETAKEALRLIARGFQSVKLKVGGDPATDARCFRAVREAVGREIELRVDANQGWTLKEAMQFARDTQGCGLAIMEQPVPRSQIEAMSTLVKSLDVPIEADEAIVTVDDMVRVIGAQAADVINIKLGKNGGLTACRTLAKMAQELRVPVVIGTDFSLGVAAAAKLHFAAAMPNFRAAAEFSELALFEFDARATLLTQHAFAIENHTLGVPTGPGLGVELDELEVARFPYHA